MKNTKPLKDASQLFCPNEGCPARGKSGADNIVSHGKKRERYKCKICKRTFSVHQGTMFEGLRKPEEQIVMVVTLLAYGCPPEEKGMLTPVRPILHLTQVYEMLIATYGTPKNEPDYAPLGGLIATILSQHTSDVNSERAYQQLVTAFPTWEEVRDAETYKVAEAIKCGGLANIKSVRIQDVLYTLTEQQQAQGDTKTLTEYLYAELTRQTTKEALHYLRQLPGVGPKTAACVLMFHLGLPAFPIDTHVGRILQRLGIISPKVSSEAAHRLLDNVLPSEWVYPLHVNLIKHGRQICHAQRPECTVCTLYNDCAYVGNVNVQETAISSV